LLQQSYLAVAKNKKCVERNFPKVQLQLFNEYLYFCYTTILKYIQDLFKYHKLQFKVEAKVIHAMYGSMQKPAIRSTLKNRTVVITIATHMITISTKAQPSACKPKNIGVQSQLRMS
jgi:hypothetical protein